MISKSGALSVVAWVELLHLSALSGYHTRFAYRSSFFFLNVIQISRTGRREKTNFGLRVLRCVF